MARFLHLRMRSGRGFIHMDYSDSRPGAGAYIFIFIVIMGLTATVVLGLGWVGAKNSPAIISANANATAISRDSLGALMVSASQSYSMSVLAIGSIAILMAVVSTPLAITAIALSYLQMRRPNNNFIIVAENRSQIRDILPHVIEGGGDINRTKTIVRQPEHSYRRTNG